MISLNLSKFNIFISKRKKTIIVSLILVTIIVFICTGFVFVVNPVIVDTVEIRAKSLATKAMNSAIEDTIGVTIDYDDIIKMTYDNYGNVSLIQANSFGINKLTKSLALGFNSLIHFLNSSLACFC